MSQLPVGWVRTTLGEIAAPEAMTVAARGSGRPYLGLEHVESHSTRILGVGSSENIRGTGKPFSSGDVLYARLRPYLNKVCAPEFDGIASTEFMVFRPTAGIPPKFLRYLLNRPSLVAYANQNAEGIERPRIAWPRMSEYRVELPPLAEQQRIVAAIEEHFSRLEAADESLTRASRRLNRLIGMVLDVVWEASWPTVAVRTIGDVVTGSTPSTAHAEYWGTGTSFITPGDLVHGRSVRSSERSLTPEGIQVARPLPARSILVTCIGATIGKTSLAAVRCATNQQINAVVVDEATMSPEFLLFAFASPRGQRSIIDTSSSTTLPILNKSRFSRIEVPRPSVDDQRRIVKDINEQLSLIDAMRDASERSKRRSSILRRSIVERALRGELVPQDPSDEPASVLLERIAAERVAKPKRFRRKRKVPT